MAAALTQRNAWGRRTAAAGAGLLTWPCILVLQLREPRIVLVLWFEPPPLPCTQEVYTCRLVVACAEHRHTATSRARAHPGAHRRAHTYLCSAKQMPNSPGEQLNLSQFFRLPNVSCMGLPHCTASPAAQAAWSWPSTLGWAARSGGALQPGALSVTLGATLQSSHDAWILCTVTYVLSVAIRHPMPHGPPATPPCQNTLQWRQQANRPGTIA